MPFDVSGNFSRSYNFTQDRNNGIKILASRVDGEFDNFAQGMNLVFFRSGQVAMTGDLNMGLNRVIGLGDGAVANPTIKWASDPLSGFFLNGYGKVAVSATGAKIAEFSSSGAAITGNLTTTGAITAATSIAGQAISGTSLTVTDAITGGILNLNRSGTPTVIDMNGTGFTGARRWQISQSVPGVSNDGFTIRDATASQNRLSIDGATGGVSINTTLNTGGAITQNGQQVYHAGNFNPALYALLSGAAFTGNISTSGTLVISGSGGFNLGTVGGAPRIDYSGGSFNMLTSGGAGASVNTGALAASGAITQGGQQVWHAGNFNPANYAALASAPTFTGTVRGPLIQAVNSGNDVLTELGSVSAEAWVSGGNTAGSALRLLALRGATIEVRPNGSVTATFTPSQATVSSPLNVTAALTQSGNQVWHAGNFNPANYAALSGAAFTGTITAPSASFASTVTSGGVFVSSPSSTFGEFQLSGTGVTGITGYSMRQGIIGVSNGGWSLRDTTNGANRIEVSPTGGVNIPGALTQAGNQVYHAGNFNPASYAALSGAAFTGPVTVALASSTIQLTTLSDAPSQYRMITLNGNNSSANFVGMLAGTSDSNTYIQMPASGAIQFRAANSGGATTAATLSSAGVFNAAGGLTRGGAQVAYDGMSRASARITDGTAAPSGGSDGDMYFQYT